MTRERRKTPKRKVARANGDVDLSAEPTAEAVEPEATARTTNKPAERWTVPLLTAGFIPVARSFLRNYAVLRPYPLTIGEAMFVVHLMDFKRDKNHPFPSYKRLARLMGCTEKHARMLAKRLEAKGYLRRLVRMGRPNQFDLTKLFDALEKQFAAAGAAHETSN